MSHRIRFIARTVAALLAATCAPSVAQAAIFTVGSPSGQGQPCTHGTIQSAIDAADNSPGADIIRLTRSLTYEPEANTINTTQELIIEGGYATCTQTTPDNTKTVVSGAGGAAAPVFTIIAPTGAWIRLRRLEISGGDVANAGLGGGIRFSGDGILDIENTYIANNVAGYGGGIAASGTGGNAELVIGANVTIAANTARYGGGGIYAHEIEMTMVAPNSFLFNNEASGVSGSAGFGGGLYLHSNHRNTTAYIGTNGAIMNNRARHGGGVALAGYNDNSGTSRSIALHLFSTDPARRGTISSNTASVSGGGIYAEGDEGAFDGSIISHVYLWNAILSDNAAPEGGALRLGGDGWAHFHFNSSSTTSGWPVGALPCTPALGDCGRIQGNTTWNGSTYTLGAILRADADTSFINIGQQEYPGYPPSKGGVVIEGNKGGRLLDAVGGDFTQIYFKDALIVSNETSHQLLRKTSSGRFGLIDITLADNLIGAQDMLVSLDVALEIQRSLLWQPGKTLLNRTGGTLDSQHNLVNENTSFGGNFNGANVIGSPRFVDPERGDYSLRVGSPAIDRAPNVPGDDRDILGNPRDRDIPYTINYSTPDGVRDIGAFERQSLQPIVLNGDFNTDLRLWDVVTANMTTRDATQNTSGPANSGSAHIMRNNPAPFQVTQGISHCIHLPGPAVYALNGWGRGTGTQFLAGDAAVLGWEFRLNGSDNCTGAPNATGFHSLSNTPNWNRPAQPALIDLSGYTWGQWTGHASLRIILEAREFHGSASTDAWFDGITLDIVPQGDELFADGFED